MSEETTTASALRERILGSRTLPEREIDVPEWPDPEGKPTKILLIGMTGKERAGFLNATAKNGRVDVIAGYPDLLIRSCYDPASRQRIFAPADRDALLELFGRALDRVSEAAIDLNGLADSARSAAREGLKRENDADTSPSQNGSAEP